MALTDEQLKQALRLAERKAKRSNIDDFTAGDIAQESVLKLQGVEPTPENWRGYLYRIVGNEVANHFRAVQRRRENLVDTQVEPAGGFSARSTSCIALRPLAVRAMEQTLVPHLNGTEIQVLVLTAEGYTGEQIAQIVGLKNADSVKATRNRARRKAASLGPALRALVVLPGVYGGAQEKVLQAAS